MHPIVRVGAEWAWRLLVLAGALWVVFTVAHKLSEVVIPVLIALLFAALLMPLVDQLQRWRIPRGIGVAVALIGSIALLAGILTFVVQQFIDGLPQLTDQFTDSVRRSQNWLVEGPLHLSKEQIHSAGDTIVKSVKQNQDTLTNGAFTTATLIMQIVSGAFLTLFITIFYLYGGDQIWRFITKVVPTPARERVRLAGALSFRSLVGLVRATVAVAAVDAVGIGAGLAIVGVPLALPLASIVFITAFIPIVGSVIGGFVAVFIALVTKGFVAALVTLGIIIAVMQLEGHVLQPLLLGRAVRIHPLAVVLAVAAGFVTAGIAGALFAFPLVAVLNTAIRSLLATAPGHESADADAPTEEPPGEGPPTVRPDQPDDPEKHLDPDRSLTGPVD
ncbi:MAG: AI-2E family transporter [Mycobacteriaceae bacterium]|nr:AI-2E family transporter [Mycobacteriaceae bacterium]